MDKEKNYLVALSESEINIILQACKIRLNGIRGYNLSEEDTIKTILDKLTYRYLNKYFYIYQVLK